MTIETLQTISFICFLLASVFFLISVAMFFILNITKVVGDLSGITAKKAIENIRSQNDSGTEKQQKHEVINNSAQTSVSTKLKKSGAQGFAQTSKLNTSTLNKDNNETTVIADAGKTSEETTVLAAASAPETSVLVESFAETTVLANEQSVITVKPNDITAVPKTYEFKIDYEIWFAASKEIIT